MGSIFPSPEWLGSSCPFAAQVVFVALILVAPLGAVRADERKGYAPPRFFTEEALFFTEDVDGGRASSNNSHRSEVGQTSEEENRMPPIAERMKQFTKEPLTPEESKKVLKTASENFVYGPGLGETALDITGAVLFPPYALVLAGQAAISLAGYEPPRLKELLPEKGEGIYDELTETVYSAPGRVVSKVSGEEFRSREAVKAEWEKVLEELEQNRKYSKVERAEVVRPSFFEDQ